LNNNEFQPNQLAKKCGINKSTLQRYLEDREMFPPIRVDENNSYRYYDQSVVDKLNFYRVLQKRPFRLTKNEIKPILVSPDFNTILDRYNQSKRSLHSFLIDKGFL
jgi:DNA-binding transcriptional MerR regulator